MRRPAPPRGRMARCERRMGFGQLARMNGLVMYPLLMVQPAAGRRPSGTMRVGLSYLQRRRPRVLRILKGHGQEGAAPGEAAGKPGRGPSVTDPEPVVPVVPALQLGHAVGNAQLPPGWASRTWRRSSKQLVPWSGLPGMLRRGWYRLLRTLDEAPCSTAAPTLASGWARMTGHRHPLFQSGHQRNVNGLPRGGGSPRRSQTPPARRW